MLGGGGVQVNVGGVQNMLGGCTPPENPPMYLPLNHLRIILRRILLIVVHYLVIYSPVHYRTS